MASRRLIPAQADAQPGVASAASCAAGKPRRTLGMGLQGGTFEGIQHLTRRWRSGAVRQLRLLTPADFTQRRALQGDQINQCPACTSNRSFSLEIHSCASPSFSGGMCIVKVLPCLPHVTEPGKVRLAAVTATGAWQVPLAETCSVTSSVCLAKSETYEPSGVGLFILKQGSSRGGWDESRPCPDPDEE